MIIGSLHARGALGSASPPPFGHSMRQFFSFDEQYINLNNGSFGSVPKYVNEASNAITEEVESNPDKFLRLIYEPKVNQVRERLASMIGAKADECVFVPNVATGVNTVLRNFYWSHEDILIITNVSYESILRAVQNISETPPNPHVSCFDLQLPLSHADILAQWRKHLRDVKKAFPVPENLESSRNIVANFDSICAGPAIVLPWRAMVAICKEEGVWSVVDAAHSIGQEPNLDLDVVQPDFWISSCSKWLYVKRACALLYVPKRNQHIIRTTLPTSAHHPSPSTGEINTFVSRFCFPGTLDVAVPLSIDAALDFREWLGGEEKINTYCHQLALEGGRRLAEIMGTAVMEFSEEQTANMATVELPLSGSVKPSVEMYFKFQRALLYKHKISATHFYHNGRWWTRASAQIFNEISDFEKLGLAFLEICKEFTGDEVL